MAWPASQQTKEDGLAEVNREALALKRDAQNRRDALASGDQTGQFVLGIAGRMNTAIAIFDRVSAITGVGAYAQDQFEDSGLDISAEFSAMRSAAIAVRDRIVSDLPTDASGFLSIRTLNADGTITERTFTPAQTANLRADLDALIATIG